MGMEVEKEKDVTQPAMYMNQWQIQRINGGRL